MNTRLNIQRIPVEKLKPAKYNPRKKLKPGDPQYEQIKRSLDEHGYVAPLVWNEVTGNIVGGHQRFNILVAEGATEIDCSVVHIEDLTQEKELNVKLNKASGLWDEELLADMFKDFQEQGVDITEATGFNPDEVDDIFSNIYDKDVHDDNTTVEPEKVEPFVEPGDIWTLGKHRMMCGDATNGGDVALLMDGYKANLVVTDPPYNVDYESADGKKIENDKMADEQFYEFLLTAFKNMAEFMAPGGSAYVFHADMQGVNFRKAFMDAGFHLSSVCIWMKESLVLGRSPYQWQHEPCQPAGTLVRTPRGEVRIEELRDGDRVVSYDSYSSTIKGFLDGLRVKTASRQYDGVLYGVCVDGRETWATDNHQFSVRFNPDTSDTWCVYVMRRGNWWRTGISRTYDARGFGLKHRFEQENADAVWMLDTYPCQADAQMAEQYVACTFGIPYTHWEIDRGRLNASPNERTSKQIDWLYSQMDLELLQKNAVRCLENYGRSIKYPLVTKDTKGQRFSRRVTARIEACNLAPGLMMLPIPKNSYEGAKTFDWRVIDDVETKPFSGPVYSLAVEKYEHYIADGIVTHNCLYGWLPNGKHKWFADRKQTTIWRYDKPKKSEAHPTMKPIQLVAYPIKNSSAPNAVVMDLFGGSGSTLIACDETDRICRTMELDPKYASAIVLRYIESHGGNFSDVSVLRNGTQRSYRDVCPE